MANDAIIASKKQRMTILYTTLLCFIDVGSVFHKLFDHRTAMHAEHNFFVKEFEVKKNFPQLTYQVIPPS